MLGPTIHKLAQSPELVGGHEFDLATVDVDKNMDVAQIFKVRAMPTVVAVRDGAVVNQFVGVLPEPALVEFIRSI